MTQINGFYDYQNIKISQKKNDFKINKFKTGEDTLKLKLFARSIKSVNNC